MKKPTILLADDHTLILEGFQRLLESNFEIVGMVDNGQLLVKEAAKLMPDIILLDISMPLLNGIDAAQKLRKITPSSKIVFLSMHSDPEYVTEAFRAGGRGYLMKRSAGSELIFALKEILKGRFYVTPIVAKSIIPESGGENIRDALNERRAAKVDLTPRQREVLQLVAEGNSVKEIASVLEVSAKTVEYHKKQIMDALDLRTTAELTRYAISHGIISIDQEKESGHGRI